MCIARLDIDIDDIDDLDIVIDRMIYISCPDICMLVYIRIDIRYISAN